MTELLNCIFLLIIILVFGIPAIILQAISTWIINYINKEIDKIDK
jgi:hypothetical protein